MKMHRIPPENNLSCRLQCCYLKVFVSFRDLNIHDYQLWIIVKCIHLIYGRAYGDVIAYMLFIVCIINKDRSKSKNLFLETNPPSPYKTSKSTHDLVILTEILQKMFLTQRK